MKVPTKDLIDGALDWAVGYARCLEATSGKPVLARDLMDAAVRNGMASPSTDWAQGGPIIEREGILLRPLRREGHALDGLWLAMFDGTNTGSMVQWVKRTDWPRHYWEGPTALIAAMRCWVASQMGEEVDVPEELL